MNIYSRLLAGIGAPVMYTSTVLWMVLSIAKPAPPDPIGVPLMMFGICIMCIFPAVYPVARWIQATGR